MERKIGAWLAVAALADGFLGSAVIRMTLGTECCLIVVVHFASRQQLDVWNDGGETQAYFTSTDPHLGEPARVEISDGATGWFKLPDVPRPQAAAKWKMTVITWLAIFPTLTVFILASFQVRLMPPAYVKAYLRRQKNDAADAEAICEAVSRPTMRFVPVKSAERHAVLVLHRSRELLVRQRTMIINAIRAHCAEFGLFAAQGVSGGRDLVERIRQAGSAVLPDMAKDAMMLLVEHLQALVRQIQALNRSLQVWRRQDQASQRLATIPGVGVISATALAVWLSEAHEDGQAYADRY